MSALRDLRVWVWWRLRGALCFCGGDRDGHARFRFRVPDWCVMREHALAEQRGSEMELNAYWDDWWRLRDRRRLRRQPRRLPRSSSMNRSRARPSRTRTNLPRRFLRRWRRRPHPYAMGESRRD